MRRTLKPLPRLPVQRCRRRRWPFNGPLTVALAVTGFLLGLVAGQLLLPILPLMK